MPRSNPASPSEFNVEAVRLVRRSDQSRSTLAQDLGVADHMLRTWVRQADIDAGSRDGLTQGRRAGGAAVTAPRGAHPAPRASDPKQSRGLRRQSERRDPVAVVAFVEAEQVHFPVAMLCRLLGVSQSGSEAWRKRPPAARTRSDQALSRQMRAMHEQRRGPDGAPPLWTELRHHGVACSAPTGACRRPRQRLTWSNAT